MQENNETKATEEVATHGVDTPSTPPEPSLAAAEVAPAAPVETAARRLSPLRLALFTGVAVLVLALGLLFMLEREGRVSTGLFGDVSSGQAAAYVNDQKIKKSDFDSSLDQMIQMAAASGVDVTNEETLAEYRTQTIETLINGELLRQEALKQGMSAPEEAINSRYAEIEAGLGGPEALAGRMAEFGVTEAVLRRDIENEILIQSLFDVILVSDDEPIEEEEVETLYSEIKKTNETVPPLSDVYEQVAEQIKLSRQQAEVAALIDRLKAEATVEILI